MYELSVRVAHEHQLTSGGRPVDVVALAIPAETVTATAPHSMALALADARADLVAGSADRGIDGVVGISTRISVAVPEDRADAVGRLVARHCLGALADVVASGAADVPSGIAVRPRRGWVEVRTEHVDGDDLAAAVVLLTGAVVTFLLGTPAPATPKPRLTGSRGRGGWFAESPGSGDLAEVWAWARTGARAGGLEPTPLDDLVDGLRPLRRDREAGAVAGAVVGDAEPARA